MKTGEKIAIGVTAVAGVGILGWFVAMALSRATGKTIGEAVADAAGGKGSSPGAPTPAAQPTGVTASGATTTQTAQSTGWTQRPIKSIRLESGRNLRPTLTTSSVGPVYPAGTIVELMNAQALNFNDSRLYSVRIRQGGATGYMPISPSEQAQPNIA